MRLLFLGDVVGPPGVRAVRSLVPKLRAAEALAVVVANAENAAGDGSGLTPGVYRHLRSSGVDAVTLGDHAFRKFAVADVLREPGEPLLRPANFPAASPGREFAIVPAADGIPVAVFVLLGRTFMRPVDCPFAAADRVLTAIGEQAKVILVDVHAEATGEKYQLAHHLAGRVSAVLGTHTHVPTADEQVLPGGTAFVCDVGMCGPYAGVLGRKPGPLIETTTTFMPTRFELATDDVRLGGAIVDVDENGRATAIRRVMVREDAAVG